MAETAPTELFTRDQYLSTEGHRYAAHRRYYAQMVTERTRAQVLAAFGIEELLRAHAAGPGLNQIPIARWDAFVSDWTNKPGQAIHSHIDYDRAARRSIDPSPGISQAELVCITKEAARQIVEEDIATTQENQ